ncbi:hypothetical protein DFH06DRAFT_1473945 [Mycena polygramma]|nr:hypothetical protein DFH06DRAFT_1473945 [Mycena polygramma]
MASPAPPISKLVHELLEAIFILCLPSPTRDVPATDYPVPIFIAPSAFHAPLLLCSVSSPWRAVATGLPRLWRSLDTENVLHPELVELWLRRAQTTSLSLRIARPILHQFREPVPMFPPMIMKRQYYLLAFPMHLHLPLLLPRISQCQHLEMVDWFIPHFFPPPVPPPSRLQSLSVIVGDVLFGSISSRDRAAPWVSDFLAHAPLLTHLHWAGPDISAPWGQLTHLSWHINVAHVGEFERTLDCLQNVVHLRIRLHWDWLHRFTSPAIAHLLPNVHTYSAVGDTRVTRFLSLPNLHHLILESSSVQATEDLELFLQRSRCKITSLELWQDHFPAIPPTLLDNPAIAPSLTYLLISSQDLNDFFCAFELPRRIRLLRDADRCFRIEPLPGIQPDATSGVLAALLVAHLPVLQWLELDDTRTRTVAFAPELESRVVEVAGFAKLTVSRSADLRRKYEAWWNSSDGLEFRAALDSEDVDMLHSFDLPWNFLFRPRPPLHRDQNIFANSDRPGYVFI